MSSSAYSFSSPPSSDAPEKATKLQWNPDPHGHMCRLLEALELQVGKLKTKEQQTHFYQRFIMQENLDLSPQALREKLRGVCSRHHLPKKSNKLDIIFDLKAHECLKAGYLVKIGLKELTEEGQEQKVNGEAVAKPSKNEPAVVSPVTQTNSSPSPAKRKVRPTVTEGSNGQSKRQKRMGQDFENLRGCEKAQDEIQESGTDVDMVLGDSLAEGLQDMTRSLESEFRSAAKTDTHPTDTDKLGVIHGSQSNPSVVGVQGEDLASASVFQKATVPLAEKPDKDATQDDIPDAVHNEQEAGIVQSSTGAQSSELHAEGLAIADHKSLLSRQATQLNQEIERLEHRKKELEHSIDSLQRREADYREGASPALKETGDGTGLLRYRSPVMWARTAEFSHLPERVGGDMHSLSSLVWSLVENYQDARGFDRYSAFELVQAPGPELEVLYKRVFGSSDWRRSRLTIAELPEKRRGQYRADRLFRSLIAAGVYENVFIQDTPWNMKQVVKQSLEQGGNLLEEIPGSRSFAEATDYMVSSLIDTDYFQNRVIAPRAKELSCKLANTLAPHMIKWKECQSNVNVVVDIAWVDDLTRIIQDALILKARTETDTTRRYDFFWLKHGSLVSSQEAITLHRLPFKVHEVFFILWPGIRFQQLRRLNNSTLFCKTEIVGDDPMEGLGDTSL